MSIPSCNPILGQLQNLLSRHVSFPSSFESVLHAVLMETLHSGFEWIVASLDRKRFGQTLRVGKMLIEAFSVRRLGGSRWRLRRTRYAMGFERQFGSQEVCEWVRKSLISRVRAAAMSCKRVGGRSGKRSLALDERRNARSCFRTSKVRN